jgi:hypothetical protein
MSADPQQHDDRCRVLEVRELERGRELAEPEIKAIDWSGRVVDDVDVLGAHTL